jgi:hypothetical protein
MITDKPPASEMPQMFLCEKTRMRLTAGGCAKLWLSTEERRPKAWEGRHACLACPIGAANAGRTVVVTALATEAWRMVCPRCRTPTDRLINHRFCVSCYNRHREAMIGRNGKGGLPWMLLTRLHAEVAAVFDGDSVQIVRETEVVDLEELIILQARNSTRPLAFGRPANVAA